MRFAMEIPAATLLRIGQERFFTLPAGTEVHRIHPHKYGAAQFNDTDLGNARFSPIRDSLGTIVPTIYAGQSFECAVSEIILRCPDAPPPSISTFTIVHPSDFVDYVHSKLRTSVDLKLVDLTVAGQRSLGVNGNALLAGPRSTYPVTRAWAAAIHAQIPTAQGLYYNSYQFGAEYAVLLFGDRMRSDALIPEPSRAVTDTDCHREIVALAKSLWIEYSDV
jgi:hypothetical protein